MRPRNVVALLVSLAVASALPSVLAQPATASPITLQIGSQSVRVPIPVGFVETSRRSQELWATALAFSAGDARIIAHFVSDKDFAEFEKGKAVHFKNFLLVQTPKRAETIIATQAQFDKLRAGTVALQSDLAQRLEPRLVTALDRVSKAISSNQATDIKVRLGEIVPVSVDRNDAQILIYTVLSQSGAFEGKSETSQTSVASTAYCFIAGKIVVLATYRQFRSPQDLHSARAQITTWANSVLMAN